MRALLLLAMAAGALSAQDLQCNTPVNGYLQPPSITVIDPLNTKPTTQVFTFQAVENEKVLVRMIIVTKDDDFKPQLVVRSPQISVVTPRTTYVSAAANFAGEYTITQTGQHTIEVSTSGKTPGTFRLLLIRLSRPCPTAVLSCGAPVASSLSGDNDFRVYTFNAEANDTLSFRLLKTGPFASNTSTGPAQTLPPTNIAMFIYGPDGLLLSNLNGDPNSTTGNPAAVQQNGRNRLQMDVQTPAKGAVTALVFDQNASASNNVATQFALSASRLNGACGDKPLNCGAVVDANLTKPIQIDGYSVDAQAGDVFTVRMARADTSSTAKLLPFAEIYDSAGKLLTNVGTTSQGQHALTQGTFRAAAAGRYTIMVEDGADGTQTGAYTIALNRLNKPCGGGQTLGCSSVVDANISGLLRQNTYTLNAAANDSFLLRVLRTGTNASFRPRVDVYDPQGNTVQTTTTADLARVNFTTTVAGDYSVIVADNFDGSQAGGYSISTVRLNRPCGAQALECGKVAAGSIDGPLRFTAFSYNATAGDSFGVRLLNPGGGLQPDIEIYDPSGQKVGTDVSGNVRGFDVGKPGAGVYTILALDSSKTPGRGEFALETLQTRNACGASPAQGATVSGIVSGATPFLSYSLPVNAGDQLMVRSASFTSGFNAFMELYDSDGVRVDTGTYSLTRRIPAAGTYTAVISASNPRSAGSFALSWQVANNPVNAPSLPCGATLAGTLSASGEYRYYLAGLNANDLAKILLTPASSGFTPQVELYDPSGARIAATGSEISQRVRADGNYLVVVTPATANGESGTYSLAFQRPNNACGTVSLACGQSALGQAALPGQIDAYRFNGNGGDITIVKLPVRTGTYSPFAELYDAAGTLVRGSSTGTLSVTLPSTGAYTLLVRDRNGSGTGNYRASLQTDPACPVDDKQAPVITLLRPTGGEVAAGGATFRIVWQSDDNVDVASHDVRLSTDGGKTYDTTLASGLSGAAQLYDWAVPASIAPTRTAVIQVTATDAAGNQQTATSDLLTLIGNGFTPNANVTLTYDSLNRVTQAVYSDGRTVTYTYDADGKLLQVKVSGN